MITPMDVAWAAGFLEGEGCFFAGTKGKSTAPTRVMGVQAAQVQKWPLEILSRLFGGNVKDRIGKGKQRDYHHWGLYGPRAAGLTMTLYTFLSPKRQAEIAKALREWRSRPAYVGYRMSCVKGHPFDLVNTKVMTGPNQKRACRQCRRDNCARWRAARKAAR